MAPDEKAPRVERAATDESLAFERGKTDVELAKRRTTTEEEADDVQALARRRADQVQSAARARADEIFHRGHPGAEVPSAVTAERTLEDEALAQERTGADETLSAERDERRRALTALLQLEREQTDSHLAFERSRIDDAIASRDDFLGMASHDLRNLLGAIAMSAESLLKIPCDDAVASAIGRDAQRIRRCTARMSRLVGDLLDVVSIEAGRLALDPSRHDARDLLRETCEAFAPLLAAKRLSIRTEVRGESLLAQYDHDRILQVLANLVGNAMKFSDEGGRIDIGAETIGDEVRFAVIDQGAGMTEEALGMVFERFGQADRRSRSGLGLGLYISRCIVEAHGGRIWASSRPGEGSTFYFTLPGAPPPTSAQNT